MHNSIKKFGTRLLLEIVYWCVRIFLDTGAIHPKTAALRAVDQQLDTAYAETERSMRHTVDIFLAEAGLDADVGTSTGLERQLVRAKALTEAARALHHRRIIHQFSWF